MSHPASCRSRRPGTADLCGHRIDQQATRPCPPALLRLQERLDALLDGSSSPVLSLGAPVSRAQKLRDLRALAYVMQLASHHLTHASLPIDIHRALTDFMDARRLRRAARPVTDRSDRTWAHPPVDTRVLAALLLEADHILSLPSPQDASDIMWSLIDAAQDHERISFNRLRTAMAPSPGLRRYFVTRRASPLSAHLVRSACPTSPSLGMDYVPAYLDHQRYQRWFAAYAVPEERSIRRAVPMAVAQLVSGCNVEATASQLGYSYIDAQVALSRAGRAVKQAGHDEDFRQLIGLVADDLHRHRTNFGERRRYFDADWDLPETDWQELIAQMLTSRASHSGVDWSRRRLNVRIWLWSEITNGEPSFAPMIQGRSAGRRSTNRAVSDYTELRRYASPALAPIIGAYAAKLIQRIKTAAPLP